MPTVVWLLRRKANGCLLIGVDRGVARVVLPGKIKFFGFYLYYPPNFGLFFIYLALAAVEKSNNFIAVDIVGFIRWKSKDIELFWLNRWHWKPKKSRHILRKVTTKTGKWKKLYLSLETTTIYTQGNWFAIFPGKLKIRLKRGKANSLLGLKVKISLEA